MKDEQLSIIQEQGDLGLGQFDVTEEEQNTIEKNK